MYINHFATQKRLPQIIYIAVQESGAKITVDAFTNTNQKGHRAHILSTKLWILSIQIMRQVKTVTIIISAMKAVDFSIAFLCCLRNIFMMSISFLVN